MTVENVNKLTEITQAQYEIIRIQGTQIVTLQADIAALKVPNPVLATFATKHEVANAINAIPVPKEWPELKAQYAATAAKTTNYESRMAIVEQQMVVVLAQQRTVTPAMIAANYSTIGRVTTLDTLLRAEIAALKARLTSHGG